MPAGENPPPGAILDYYLGADASGPVTIEILDGAGKVGAHATRAPIRSGIRIPRSIPSPTIASAATIPRRRTAACRSTGRRRRWSCRRRPACIASAGTCGSSRSTEGGGRGGASVPRRTYPAVNAPWAPPGSYTVRLTVDGKSYTQPLTLHLDPRVKTPALGLSTLTSLTREMYDGREGRACRGGPGARARGNARRDGGGRRRGVQGAARRAGAAASTGRRPRRSGRRPRRWAAAAAPGAAPPRWTAPAPRCWPRRWRCRGPTSRRPLVKSPHAPRPGVRPRRSWRGG